MIRHWKSIILLILAALTYSCQYQSPDLAEKSVKDSLIYKVEQIIKEKRRAEEYKERRLTKEFLRKTEEYYPTIRKYSKRYGLDWRLIVAQILRESYFKENAVSQMGARGLMQIMPYTASEITKELDYEYIFRDPKENITAGIYHLYKQMAYFPDANYENRVMLALAAYNGGAGRVVDAQDIAGFLYGKRNEWKTVKIGLTKLTSSDWKLHLEVWELGVPPNGYFYGYQETIDYVDDIMKTYQVFRKLY